MLIEILIVEFALFAADFVSDIETQLCQFNKIISQITNANNVVIRKHIYINIEFHAEAKELSNPLLSVLKI